MIIVTGQKVVKAAQNIFSPCVAFRVVGTPVKHINSKYSILLYILVFHVLNEKFGNKVLIYSVQPLK